jgi:hypothetical protein
MNKIDLSGLRFNRWTVIGPQRMIPGGTKWMCRCDCGVEREVKSASLRRGLSTSCGCRQREILVKDMVGERYGRLVVKERAGSIRDIAQWLCVCDCGKETRVTGDALRRGNTRSCGCLLNEARKIAGRANKTHGMSYTPTHKSWSAMKGRCSNPKDDSYANYGGRGIKVCDRWNSFENFFADMGEAPSGLTIDREDVNGNYEPSNCRWATDTEQARNTRVNRIINAFGKSMTLADWGDETGLDVETISTRIKRGWTIEKALTTKPGNNAGGKRLNLFVGEKLLLDIVPDASVVQALHR